MPSVGGKVCAVTPYIYAMSQHAAEFNQIRVSLLSSTQQGLEKYNDNTTNYLLLIKCG